MIPITKRSLFMVAVILISAISFAKATPSERGGNLDKISPPIKNLLITRLIEKNEYNLSFRILIETATQSDIGRLDCFHSNLWFVTGNILRADASLPELITASTLDYVKRIYIMDQIVADRANTGSSDSSRVVIGLVDIGMDWKSECFLNKPTGETRILYYWDQAAQSLQENSKYMCCVPYGIEFDGKDLQNILNTKTGSVPFHLGHGWIMAAIAAGDVHIKDQNKTEIFKNSRLNTPIIMVNTTARKSAIFDAVAYIVRKAGDLGAKCVINFSYSKHFGPHIEEQTFVKALDSLLDDNSILVVPGGNDRTANVFASKEIKRQTFIEFRLEKESGLTSLSDSGVNVNIELWIQNNLDMEVTLISPDDDIIGPIAGGKSRTFKRKNGTFHFANAVSKAVGKWSGISIMFGGFGDELPQDGDWKIKLTATGRKTEGFVKGWITDVKHCDLHFKNGDGISNSISTLAFSKKMLSVGSVSVAEDNKLVEAVYSSRMNLEGETPKPDVLTIGKVMVRPPEFNNFFTQEGTSVSSALITRLVADIWDARPYLNAATIKDLLHGKIVYFGDKKGITNLVTQYQVISFKDLLEQLEKK